MKRHIICLGDSNTHGYCADPADCAGGPLHRFDEDERWTCLLQRALGEEVLVLEEGLSGRTTVFDDPLTPGMRGLDYLYPCLMSHEPVSLLIVMLGTNDTKSRFSANEGNITAGLERLVRLARGTDCWGPGGTPRILLIAPAPIDEGVYASPVSKEMGPGCVEKSRGLAAGYRELAQRLDCAFLDAGQLGCTYNTVDFMHLTRQGHRTLAEALAELVPTLI